MWSGKSLKGSLLLDHGKLRGSFFHRTVILVCQHDAEGAFGLVLNRQVGKKVGDVIVANLADWVKEQGLFLGGPVQPQALSYLVAGGYMPEGEVMPNLSLGHSLEGLVDLGESYNHQTKIFAGYAGWSSGQLDDELKRETWLVHPGTPDWVFHGQPEELWQRILRGMGWKYGLLADAPDDLTWN